MSPSQQKPDTLEMIQQLIATPSISCVDPSTDQSNMAVINLLANWLNELDFEVEILPVNKGKANLIATLGRGSAGSTTPLNSAKTMDGFTASARPT